jgi:uncharacterized protein with HEPN domain
MSKRDDRLYFGHMLDIARKIVTRCQGLTRTRFDTDEDSRIVLLHLVQTLGEAARRVSPGGQAAHPEIPWRQITGMRHRIVHDYMDVSYPILWEVVTVDVPALLDLLERLALPEDI